MRIPVHIVAAVSISTVEVELMEDIEEEKVRPPRVTAKTDNDEDQTKKSDGCKERKNVRFQKDKSPKSLKGGLRLPSGEEL